MVDAVTAKCAGETRQPAQHDSFTTCIGIHDCTECSKHTYLWTEQSARGVPSRGPEPSCQGLAATGRRRQVYNTILQSVGVGTPHNSQFQSYLLFLPSSLHHQPMLCSRLSSARHQAQPLSAANYSQPKGSHLIMDPKSHKSPRPRHAPNGPWTSCPPVPLRSSASYDGRAPTNDSRRRPPRPCWADGARRNGGKRKKISWIK